MPHYRADPDDPDAPIPCSRYSAGYGVIEPGSRVEYVNPELPPGAQLGGPHTVTEMWIFGAETLAVLDGGEWECSADNLRLLPVGPTRY